MYLAYLYKCARSIGVLGSVGDRTGLVIDGTQIDAGGRNCRKDVAVIATRHDESGLCVLNGKVFLFHLDLVPMSHGSTFFRADGQTAGKDYPLVARPGRL